MPRTATTARVTTRLYPSQSGGDGLLTLGVAGAPFWADGPFSERTLRTAVRDGAPHLWRRVDTQNSTGVLAQELEDEMLLNSDDGGSFAESKPNDESGTFSKRMKEAFATAKIDDFVVHDLRHTAAYRLWRDTSDIELVRVFLGHADVSQTRRYINVSAEDVAFAMRKKAEKAGRGKKAKAGLDKDKLKQVLRRQFEDRMAAIRADEEALLV